jgi:hypothetical protein
MYMAEDAAFKLHYFMKLRSEGLSRAGAAMEVGRSLPIYHTVGKTPASWRKYWLPWLSFQVEAVRIMKNNLVDHPLRMGMWMHAMDGMQAMMYPFLGMSAEEIKQEKEMLPMWAQKPMGGVLLPGQDKNNDMRTMILDWLPEASFMPPTVAKDAPLMQKLPMGASQPMPILMGMVHAIKGEDPWGRELPTDSPAGKIRNTALNLGGFLAPPLLQKYAMSTHTPTPTWRLRQDLGHVINPASTKKGDAGIDFWFNNFALVGKAYASSAEQKLANETFTMRGIRAWRGKLWRDFNAFTRSGLHEQAARTLTDIQRTFNREWGADVGMAQKKFGESLQLHSKSLLQHPMLRSLGKDKLNSRIAQLLEVSADQRTQAQGKMLAALRRELMMREFSSRGGSVNPITQKSSWRGQAARWR